MSLHLSLVGCQIRRPCLTTALVWDIDIVSVVSLDGAYRARKNHRSVSIHRYTAKPASSRGRQEVRRSIEEDNLRDREAQCRLRGKGAACFECLALMHSTHILHS